MEKLSICIKPESLRKTASGSIDGILFFQVSDQSFPAEDWYDFPAFLLRDWIKPLTSYTLGSTDGIQLYFIDGPYWIKLNRSKQGSEISFFEEKKCVSHFELDLQFFVRQIMAACSTVTSHFPDTQNEDISSILDWMPKLRKALDQLRN